MSGPNTTPSGIDHRLSAVTLLDVRSVAKLLAIHQRSVWRLAARANAGQSIFPKPLRLGPKLIRWRLRDVEAYLAALASEGR